MDPFSLEDFFLSPSENDSPGSQLYLYRMLHLLASRKTLGASPAPVSYQGANRLAKRLGIDSTERLVPLFNELGIGDLQSEIGPDSVQINLAHRDAPSQVPDACKSACELERGIIDGSLELITGIPVTTIETSCWSKGGQYCVFEAVMDEMGDKPKFSPGPGSKVTVAEGRSSHSSTGPSEVRSWYMDLAARELARSRRHGRQLSLVYVDLDDLGRVNADHGRAAGDQIISAVSAALSKSCRAEDYLWYNGEDEFAILLSETDQSEADTVARRLCSAIISAAEYIDFAATVSASIGYSTFPVHADNIASLLERARSALYLAKAKGKGRSQGATEPEKGTDAAISREIIEESTQTVEEEEEFTSRRSMAVKDQEEIEVSATPEGQKITFVIALSGPLLMEGVKQVIGSDEGIDIVSEVAEPSGLADAIVDNRPDMIFIDMGMAIADDFASLKLVDDLNLPSKFIVFADVVDQEVIKLAADYNVDGIILQSAAASEIKSAIVSVYKGETVLPEEAKAAMKELESKRQLLGELSDREREVLKLVAEGKSNSQISDELYITVNTVRFHLANIYQKLNVSNRTEAANCYLKQDMEHDSQTRLL